MFVYKLILHDYIASISYMLFNNIFHGFLFLLSIYSEKGEKMRKRKQIFTKCNHVNFSSDD